MKKILTIMVLTFIIALFIIFYIYNNFIKVQMLSNRVNEEYNKFTENIITGSNLMTLINKVSDQNESNNVEKGYQDLYKDNNTNSIKIEVKFLESDKIYPMEQISKLGSEKFVKNYNIRTFKCTKKEYHSETGQIKYMLFEEVE